MRVLLSVYGSRGDVQPLVALAVALRDLGAEVQMCAPPDDDYAELLTRARVPVIPVGAPIRSIAPPSSAADLPRRAAELVATQFDPVAAAAAGCDALVAAWRISLRDRWPTSWGSAMCTRPFVRSCCRRPTSRRSRCREGRSQRT
jgi:hypothetical protein